MASYYSTSTIGSASLDPSYYWSKDKYNLSTGYGSVSQTSLESFSGASANLDTVSKSAWGYGYANATEGSAVSTKVYLEAGESVSWSVKGLSSKDYVGDFAYASVSYQGDWSNTKKLFDDGYTTSQTPAWSNGTNVSFKAFAAGYYTFTTGIVDAGDTAVDSQISVSNFGTSITQNYNKFGAVSLSPEYFVPVGPLSSVDTTVKYFGNANAESGGYKLTTSDSVQTKTDFEVESWLGLAGGSLDQVEKENPYGYATYANATSGSAMKKYVKVNGVGDTIKFNYFFDGNEYIPYDDFAFVTVGGKVVSNETSQYATLYKTDGTTKLDQKQYVGIDSKALVSVQGAGSYNDVKGVFEYKVKSSDNIVTDVNNCKYVELGIGIMDEGDTVVDSNLFVSDIGSSADNGYFGFGSSSYFNSFNFSTYTSQSFSTLQSSAQSLKSTNFSSNFSQFEYSSSSYTSQTLKQNSSMIASSLTNLDFGLISSTSSISSKFDWNSTFNTLFNSSSLSTSLNISVSVDIKAVQTQVLNQIDWSGVNFGNVQSSTYKAIDFNQVNLSAVNFSSSN